jgi:hypothetical protein
MEIAPEINAQFELINQKEAFKLPNFTVIEAASVFKGWQKRLIWLLIKARPKKYAATDCPTKIT